MDYELFARAIMSLIKDFECPRERWTVRYV